MSQRDKRSNPVSASAPSPRGPVLEVPAASTTDPTTNTPFHFSSVKEGPTASGGVSNPFVSTDDSEKCDVSEKLQGDFRRTPASGPAVRQSVPHGVVSQVIRPEIAAFMAGDRVVVRNHHDELCCVDTAKFVADGQSLTASHVEYLKQFPHLVRLKVSCFASNRCCRAGCNRRTFSADLDLSGCDTVDAAGLAEVGKLKHLQHLDLRGCDGVDATGLVAISKLSRLQQLDLSGCGRGVDSAGLASIGRLTRLRRLLLNQCPRVDAAGLAELSALPLRHLELRWCAVDAAGLAAVGKLSPLQHLDLSHCYGIDAPGLAEIAKLSQLEDLNLSSCDGLDAAVLLEIAQLPHLQQLDLSGCGCVSSDQITVLRRSCRNVEA